MPESDRSLGGLSATLPESLFLRGLTEGLPTIRPGAVDICRPMMVRYSRNLRSHPMIAAHFRRIALSLEGVEEYSHAGLPAFRVGGRKFASLASQAAGYGNLMLTLARAAGGVCRGGSRDFLANSWRLGKKWDIPIFAWRRRARMY